MVKTNGARHALATRCKYSDVFWSTHWATHHHRRSLKAPSCSPKRWTTAFRADRCLKLGASHEAHAVPRRPVGRCRALRAASGTTREGDIGTGGFPTVAGLRLCRAFGAEKPTIPIKGSLKTQYPFYDSPPMCQPGIYVCLSTKTFQRIGPTKRLKL